jgi:hypothetical protein
VREEIDATPTFASSAARCGFLPMLEILDCALVSFGRFLGTERSEITSAAGLRLSLQRIQPIVARFQLPNHVAPLSPFDE